VKQRYRSLAAYFEQTERPQVDLARELGVSKGFVSMLVNGDRKASPALAMRIAEVTGVNLASLVDPKLAALLVKAS
jgi:plasmid maintenance system antidote protein VapI